MSLDQTMTLPVIPVVLGSANYSKFAPPNSYIDVSKFDSAKDLAEFLHYVSSDVQTYNSYFEWKDSYRYRCILSLVQSDIFGYFLDFLAGFMSTQSLNLPQCNQHKPCQS